MQISYRYHIKNYCDLPMLWGSEISGFMLGELQAVEFISQSLTETEKHNSQTEKDLFAMK